MTNYRGARAIVEQAAKKATEQKNADKIASKAQRVHKAAAKAKTAKELADDHDNQLTTGVLKALDIGRMATLSRLQGALPNANLATIEDATKLADKLVKSSKLDDLAVSAQKLANYAVGPGKVDDNAITSRAIAANAVVANAIAADAVLARSIASQDSASFNLWAQNAMIQSAKIAALTVDKLMAGTFTAGDIILAGGGRLRGGGTWMDSSGIRMPFIGGNYDAAVNADYKITGPDNREAIAFFRTSGLAQNYQGVQIRGDGITNNDNMGGEVILQSSSAGGNLGASIEIATRTGAGIINLNGGNNGRIQAFGTLSIQGRVFPSDGYTANWSSGSVTIPANSNVTLRHNLNTVDVIAAFQVNITAADRWRPMEFYNGVRIEWLSANYLNISNDTAISQQVRGIILMAA